MADKTIACKECKVNFVFTEREQDFYREKGFQNEPQKCPDCRAAQKQRMKTSGGGGGRSSGGSSSFGRPQRETFDAICAECGKKTQVPFKPNGQKPVYCKDCYQPPRR